MGRVAITGADMKSTQCAGHGDDYLNTLNVSLRRNVCTDDASGELWDFRRASCAKRHLRMDFT
jgi:hypothetical protein